MGPKIGSREIKTDKLKKKGLEIKLQISAPKKHINSKKKTRQPSRLEKFAKDLGCFVEESSLSL